MPYQITVDPTLGAAHVTAWGPSSVAEVLEAMERIIGDAAYRPTFPILVDASRLEYVASFSDALAMRDAFEANRNHFRGPIAVVVVAPVQYGATRVVASLADLFGVRIGVFRTVAEAQTWLTEQVRGEG